MSTPLSKAWQWSVERSPLLNAFRHLARRNNYPRAKARALISAADLPDDLAKLIDTTITRTKLWRSERADIAQELITHTQDALEAGRTPDQIIGSFGNPKKAAKLLRRATKRKRPLYWRTLRNLRRAVATLTILIFLTYGSLAARFFTGKPNITKNYAVLINAQNDAYTEDEKAWPVYEQLVAAWELHTHETKKRQVLNIKELNADRDYDDAPLSAGLSSYPKIPTDHPDYEETVQLFKDFEPQLKRLREAAHRPIIGIELGFDYDIIPHENELYHTETIPPSNNAEKNPSLSNLLLPHLGTIRKFANILAFDTLIAARESNSQRTYENLSAMLAMSRHQSFDQTLISDIVNTAITELTIKVLTQIINQHPSTLTRDHLVALSHEITITKPVYDYSLQGEAMMFNDAIQRAYTDDGHGNGRITKDGMLMFLNYDSGHWEDSELDGNTASMFTGPISLAIIPDRKSQTTRYNAMLDAVRHVVNTGPHTIALIESREDFIDDAAINIPGVTFSPTDILMPALGRAIERSFIAQMNADATITMLAIEIYKLDTGHLPVSLSDLKPKYLPQLPQDIFNPGQPIKFINIDTGYRIYSVASDADDDQSRQIDDPNTYARHSLKQRYPPKRDNQGNIILDNAGNPKLNPPRGPDGDWILIDMTPTPQTHPPK